MEYEKIREHAIKVATLYADRMHSCRDSEQWKEVFENKKRQEYYLMTTPPNN